ncbi:serine/arginine repetitive matrix protein 1-like [Plutella xylostella]|uniref:serine/arginine repetitive matrix protein 1-like n=1 Tax=Plutella xylostella TaxID=51655 RepID=UPI002032B524|nr:serine/arginine repetitive matrix protein 1-like [Plutella xylostella]
MLNRESRIEQEVHLDRLDPRPLTPRVRARQETAGERDGTSIVSTLKQRLRSSTKSCKCHAPLLMERQDQGPRHSASNMTLPPSPPAPPERRSARGAGRGARGVHCDVTVTVPAAQTERCSPRRAHSDVTASSAPKQAKKRILPSPRVRNISIQSVTRRDGSSSTRPTSRRTDGPTGRQPAGGATSRPTSRPTTCPARLTDDGPERSAALRWSPSDELFSRVARLQDALDDGARRWARPRPPPPAPPAPGVGACRGGNKSHHSPPEAGQDTAQKAHIEDPQPSTSASPTHAKNDFYAIVVSSTPVKSPRKSPSPSRELEAADDEQEALTDEDWTDIESVASGRESLLPPVIGKHTGVCKDLATARAREYLMAGKGAIESANNLKREIRTIAVEQLSNLYEMVLYLADSRNRHKLLR